MAIYHFPSEVLGNKAILADQYCALSSGPSIVIKSVEIIFRPYYFVELFGTNISRKGIMQKKCLFLFCFFCNMRKICSAALS